MAKNLLKVFVLVLLVFSFTHVEAYPSGQGFGGKVSELDHGALVIKQAETNNRTCDFQGGRVIEVALSQGGTKAFYAPPSINPVTPHPLRKEQWILGVYSKQKMIICKNTANPPSVVTVHLDTLSIFGTSR